MNAILTRSRPARASASGTAGARRPDRVTMATWVAAVVAGLGLVGVVVFGALWWNAANGDAAKAAATREDALAAARQIAVNLQTLDYKTVDNGLDTWMASATGPLLDEFKQNRQQYADKMRQVQTSTTARLVDAALSDLDVAGGKATAIAALDLTTIPTVNGTPALPETRQVRIKLDLVRTPDGWKAASASPIRS